MEAAKKVIRKGVLINSTTERVWGVLTDNALMAKWVSDDDIKINTSWEPQTPITFTGTWHHGAFNDHGIVLVFKKEKMLKYSYFSAISELPDLPENYLIITFRLKTFDNETLLELTTENITDHVTYGHWNFYWTVTLGIIKRLAEDLS